MTDKNITSGQTYLQLFVPLDRRAGWYRALKAALGGVRGTRWQDGHFHVTVGSIGLVAAPQISSALSKADDRFYREFKWAVREWAFPIAR